MACEVSKLGGNSELQLPAYTTATATQDPNYISDLDCSSLQHRILNPLSKARIKLQPHGQQLDSFPLHHNRNSSFPFSSAVKPVPLVEGPRLSIRNCHLDFATNQLCALSQSIQLPFLHLNLPICKKMGLNSMNSKTPCVSLKIKKTDRLMSF